MHRFALAIAAALASLAAGDVLTLRDGTVLHGRVIDDNDRTVIFRIELGDAGSISREFRKSQIRKIERGDESRDPDGDGATTQPAAQKAASRPTAATSQPRSISPVARDAYFEQMMREGLELLDDQDEEAALRAFQRLAQRAPESLLKRLDALCQSTRGVALPKLMAQLRMKQAERDEESGKIELGFATRYESAELGALLETRYEELLEQVFEGRSLRRWTDKRDEFPAQSREAGAMARTARTVVGLITARLRQDRGLNEQREKRAKLIALRDDLARLISSVAPGSSVGNAHSAVDEIRDLTQGQRKKPRGDAYPDSESEDDSDGPPLDSDPSIWSRDRTREPQAPSSAPAREPPPLGDAP